MDDHPTMKDWLDAGAPETMPPGKDGMGWDWSCFDETGFCGCGEPQAARKFLLNALLTIESMSLPKGAQHHEHQYPHEYGSPESVGLPPDTPDALFWIWCYWLDDRGLTEHGGNASTTRLDERGSRR